MSRIDAMNQLHRANAGMLASMQKISKGSKFPGAADNPSDYAISDKMGVNIRSVEQANANTQNSNAKLNVASGALQSTTEELGKLREKILNASNGTNNDLDRSNLQKEVNQIVEQVDENAGVTYNGKRLLDGERSFAVAGPDGVAKEYTLGDMSASGLGLKTEDGKMNIDLSTAEGRENALNIVDIAMERAMTQEAAIGATQKGLSYQSANYTTVAENTEAAASTMGATDFAKASTALKQGKVEEDMAMFGLRAHMSLYEKRNNIVTLLM